jgi:diacylglycerol O-acyltransferase / wax synthase
MPDAATPLSPADARILALESESVLGHTLKLLVLEPGEPLDLETVRAKVSARLGAFPRAGDRVEDTAGGPVWVAATAVDPAAHVRQHPATTPADLRAIVDTLMSERLDRTRPLWTIDLIGPLADGREAVAVRLHHAMADGTGAVRFLDTVLLEPHDPPLHAARTPSPRPSRWRVWERMPAAVLRELGRPGSRSPFDRPITSARALAFADLSLDDIRRIGASRSTHATVNDVLLAVVAGGMRRWLGTAHAVPRVRAQVPVSLHVAGEAADAGNRDSFLDIDLLLHEADDGRRLDAISAQTRVRKQDQDAVLLDDLFRALAHAGSLGSLVRRLADDPREFGVAISNVPGPRVPVSLEGRRVEHFYSSSEPGAHHALRIAAISNDRWLGVGFCVDPGAVADVAGLADATHDAYEALAREA